MICVYKILSPDLQECYVGSTTDFEYRISGHKCNANTCTSKILFEKYGFDNCKFVVLEQCTEEELKVKEQWWMDHSVGLVNCMRATFDKEIDDDKRRARHRASYQKNKESGRQRVKEWREANKEKVHEFYKKWREAKKLKTIL